MNAQYLNSNLYKVFELDIDHRFDSDLYTEPPDSPHKFKRGDMSIGAFL